MAKTWYYTHRILLPKTIKLGSNPLHTEPVLQLTRKVERIRKRHGTTISTYRRTHRTTWKPSSQENLWKTTWRSYGRFLNVNMAIWRMFMNTLFEQQFISDYDKNLRFVKNYIWKTTEQLFMGNRKADQWSDRNHRHKPDQFPRFEVGVDNLIAQSTLSIFHCQSLRLLQLCALNGKNGDNPVESWKKQI